MKSAQLGSAAWDGQMAKSTWKYKWVCTRRRVRIWLVDATFRGHGFVMQEEGALWVPTLLVCSTSRSPSCSPPTGIPSHPCSQSSQIKYFLLKKAVLVKIKDICVLFFFLFNSSSHWTHLIMFFFFLQNFGGMNVHGNYSKGIIFLTAVFSWITDLESADFN